jgi:uncharacterized membrane protein YgdD (TMEM256/DUF423 family)
MRYIKTMINNQQKMRKVGNVVLWFVGILLILGVALFAGNYYFLVEEYKGNSAAQVR